MPEISFFVPAYNCSATIEECIDSIMETNFSEGDEMVIVNDCSTDKTAEVLNKLKEKYQGIVIITHLSNKGGAAARNTAVENTKHELLFCLDADNVLAAGSIAPLKNYLVEKKADVASFQNQHFFLQDKFKPQYVWSVPEGEFDNTLYYKGENTPGQHGNYLFTKQSWLKAKGYAEGTGALDTWTFGLRQAITGAKAVVLKDTHYFHRLDYNNSYWMRDAEANLWSVSEKAAYSLYPFFEIIEEKFLNYMLGKGRYYWFYTLKKKPIQLVRPGKKDQLYTKQNLKARKIAYPESSIIERIINKLKRILKISDSR